MIGTRHDICLDTCAVEKTTHGPIANSNAKYPSMTWNKEGHVIGKLGRSDSLAGTSSIGHEFRHVEDCKRGMICLHSHKKLVALNQELNHLKRRVRRQSVVGPI